MNSGPNEGSTGSSLLCAKFEGSSTSASSPVLDVADISLTSG